MTVRHPWAIVLAGGEGTRVRRLTRDGSGLSVPKQFWRWDGGPSLLRRTLARARVVAPPERVLPVVAEHHRRWWRWDLGDIPPSNVIVHTINRGTAVGLLLPLLSLFFRELDPLVVVLPSDHHVRDEEPFETALRQAIRVARARPAEVVLLGVEPDSPDPEYGWLVPGPARRGGTRSIAAFVEKPALPLAAQLMKQGALWNSFLFVASARALLGLYRVAQPELLDATLGHLRSHGWDPKELAGFERRLPITDFSRHVLERVPDRLRVVRVATCGWTDVGTPARLRAWMSDHASRALRLPGPESEELPLAQPA